MASLRSAGIDTVLGIDACRIHRRTAAMSADGGVDGTKVSTNGSGAGGTRGVAPPPPPVGGFPSRGGGAGSADGSGGGGSGPGMSERAASDSADGGGGGFAAAQWRKDYKKTISSAAKRASREADAVQIRRVKRSERVMKRRLASGGHAISTAAGEQLPSGSGGDGAGPRRMAGGADGVVGLPTTPEEGGATGERPVGPRLESGGPVDALSTRSAEERAALLASMIEDLKSGEMARQIPAVKQIRMLLSIDVDPPIAPVVEAGAVPFLVGALSMHDQPELQFEAAWALTNIASGSPEFTDHVVVECGAVDALVPLITSEHEDAAAQAVWALGNIAGDSPRFRDVVIEAGTLEVILRQLDAMTAPTIDMLRNCAWCIANICRGKPQPDYERVAPSLDTLNRLVYSDDEDVMVDACWAIAYLSGGSVQRIQRVIEAGVVLRMVELLSHPSPLLASPVLRVLGNICTGNELQTQVVIAQGALPSIAACLAAGSPELAKEAAWALSNIAAGSWRQVQAIIDARIIPQLLDEMRRAPFGFRKEAAWVIANISRGKFDQVMYLVSQHAIAEFVAMLSAPDVSIVSACLDALLNVLLVGEAQQEKVGSPTNPHAYLVEEAGGLDALMGVIETSTVAELVNKASAILDRYFKEDGVEADEVDDNVAPAVNAGGGTFGFGAQLNAGDAIHFGGAQ